MNNLRRKLDKLIHKREAAVSQVKKERQTLKDSKQQIKDTQEAQRTLQEIAQQVQTQAHQKIAKVVSRCLSAVFDDPYELKIEFERKRGKTEARFVYVRNGYEVNPKVTSGGVREVASLALRFASLVLTMPPARKLLVLDEPFGGISATNFPKISVLLSTLAEELSIQIIIVTHDKELQIGKVIHL